MWIFVFFSASDFFFFFKQKTAYEMRISDWSSDVCSSDLGAVEGCRDDHPGLQGARGDHPPRRPRSGGTGDLQGRRRQHRGHGRCDRGAEVGRAACRERVCQYVENPVGGVSFKQNRGKRLITQTETTILHHSTKETN